MISSPLASSPCGHLVPTINKQMAFVPNPLPRHLELSPSLIYLLDEASRAVATLAGVGETIPNPDLLIRPFVRREAVLSSRIEGTQASLSELFLYEASGERRPKGDVVEVANYVLALNHGIELLVELPICVRLVNAIHGVLLSRGVRGTEKRPGELRPSQVWIGSEGTPIEDSPYVPPPANLVRELLLDLERFVNEPLELPPLIQCALLHYQFEAIHPYLDGNGRVGRLLISLFLIAKKILPKPLLYLSAFFERDRNLYYNQLYQLSVTSDWEAWIRYFLRGVAEQSHDALLRIRRVRALQEESRRSLQERRETGNALRLLDELFATPCMTVPIAAKFLGITPAGTRRILDRFVELDIVEFYPNYWPRLYVARELLQAIEAPITSE